jgi:hypothetical protein
LADAYKAGGHSSEAIRTFQESLRVLATSAHDQGSVANKIRVRLVAALVGATRLKEALDTVRDMLPFASNVHIAEHDVTMKCVEQVVAAVIDQRPLPHAALLADALLLSYKMLEVRAWIGWYACLP